jgi:hypothetical protein
MSEEPLKFLRFRNQVEVHERNFLAKNNIFTSAFSNTVITPTNQSVISENEEEDEDNSERILCFIINKHVYGYLFSVLRADPCLLLRLFTANRFLGAKRVFTPIQQVDFVFELFPLDCSSENCLVFYSKLTRLFLESLFSGWRKDFFELLTKFDFSATSSTKFIEQVFSISGNGS